jgi:hypothetical protein
MSLAPGTAVGVVLRLFARGVIGAVAGVPHHQSPAAAAIIHVAPQVMPQAPLE